jgi:hypothetical protein
LWGFCQIPFSRFERLRVLGSLATDIFLFCVIFADFGEVILAFTFAGDMKGVRVANEVSGNNYMLEYTI